jgi:hypothetical protein
MAFSYLEKVFKVIASIKFFIGSKCSFPQGDGLLNFRHARALIFAECYPNLSNGEFPLNLSPFKDGDKEILIYD